MVRKNKTLRSSKRTPAIPEVKTIGPETLKALSDPLRVHLLDALVGEPRTVKQLAARFRVAPTRLYYHINLLMKHGLVRVASTQIVSGIIEKHYQATARHFKMDRSALSGASTQATRALDTVLAFVFDEAEADIRKGVRNGRVDLSQTPPQPQALLLRRGFGNFTPAQAKQVYERLLGFLEEFSDIPDEDAPDVYSFVLAFYPSHTSADHPTTKEKST